MRGLHAPAGKYLVGIVAMVMVMMVAVMAALMVMTVAMMAFMPLFMVVVMTAPVVLLMVVVMTARMVLIVVMTMAALVAVIVAVMMVVPAADGTGIRLLLCEKVLGQGIAPLHGPQKLCAGELIPGGCDRSEERRVGKEC